MNFKLNLNLNFQRELQTPIFENTNALWWYYISPWRGCSWEWVIEIFAGEGHISYCLKKGGTLLE